MEEKKKKPWYSQWWAIVLYVIIGLIIIANMQSDKKTEVADDKKPAVTETVTEAVTEVVQSVDAKVLLQAYTENEVKADLSYKDKIFIITGTIDGIGKDILDTPYISLGKSGEYAIASVQCMFDKNGDVLATLKEGDSVKIKGKIDSFLVNVIVRDCELVK